MRGNVEQTLRYIVSEMNEIGWREEIPNEMQGLFSLNKNEFIDTGSIRYPRKQQAINRETFVELEEMTEEDIRRAKEEQEREAYNPYAKERMKKYLEDVMAGEKTLSCDDLPLQSKRDLLCALSAVAYSNENGFTVRLLDGYLETDRMLLRRFDITKEDKF